MLAIGFVELTALLLIAFVSLIIPTATLVLVVLIYRKLSQIQRLLSRHE